MPSGATGTSGEAISMTTISRSTCCSACRTNGAYSASTIKTLAFPCMSEKAIFAASRRVFSGLSTAPSIGTAKCASIISGMFDAMIATVSSRLTPSCASAGCEPGTAIKELRIGIATLAVDHCQFVGEGACGAGQEADGRQRYVVGRMPVQIGLERMCVCIHWIITLASLKFVSP